MGAYREGVQSHRTGKKNEKRKKKERKRKTDSPVQTPTGLTYVVRVRGFGGGAQGGARGWRSDGWHWEGVCRYLATAWMLRFLGVRVRREARGLSGAGGRAHELGKKKKKKHTTCSSCCAYTADARAGGR